MNTSAPRFSILITSYRSIRFLKDCMDTVLAATGPSYEVLFLDNGSPEPEAEWVQNYVNDPRLRVFKLEDTRYFAGGNNYIAKEARGEFLILLNSDTRVEPDWLEVMDAYLRNTGFEAAQADIRGDTPADVRPPPGYRLDRMGLMVEVTEAEVRAESRVFLACAAAFAIRRDVFEELGGLDETFRMYWEDIDLCWRANMYGYRIGYVPGSIVYHIGGGSSRKSFFKWTHYRVIRNRILAFTKNAGLPLLATFLLLTLLLRIATFPVNLLRGRVGKAVSEAAAVFSAVYLIGKALRQRGGIQRGRRVSDAALRSRRFITTGFKYSNPSELVNLIPRRKKKNETEEALIS